VGALILDASVLIGLLDTADAHHERAVLIRAARTVEEQP
jgi:predicted nucleic acid-binding protein